MDRGGNTPSTDYYCSPEQQQQQQQQWSTQWNQQQRHTHHKKPLQETSIQNTSQSYQQDNNTIQNTYTSYFPQFEQYPHQGGAQVGQYPHQKGAQVDQYHHQKGAQVDQYHHQKGTQVDQYHHHQKGAQVDHYTHQKGTHVDQHRHQKGAQVEQYHHQKGTQSDQYHHQKGSQQTPYQKTSSNMFTPQTTQENIGGPQEQQQNQNDHPQLRVDPIKLEYYIGKLQELVSNIPPQFKKRLPYDVIVQLAHAVLDGTVFEITSGLQDIQALTEQNLAARRTNLIQEQSVSRNTLLKRHNEELALCQRKPHQIKVLEKKQEGEKASFKLQCEQELTALDKKLVLELDNLVANQQSTLHRAGLPLFFLTSEPEDIKLQIYVLSFIIKLAA